MWNERQDDDLRELLQSLQVLRSDLEELERTCHRQFCDFMAVLEAMEDRCNSILYQGALVCGQDQEKRDNNPPDGK